MINLSTLKLICMAAAMWLPALYAATTAASDDPPLNHIEISGISILTPADKIADILTANGYRQVNSTLFTKQAQHQNKRKTIFRIEVEDTASFRQIHYHRSLSGGRVKSSVDVEPVPEFELTMAKQLYKIVCDNVPETLKSERDCEPFELSSIKAGNGQLIDINDHQAVQLSATAANTAIAIKYIYE